MEDSRKKGKNVESGRGDEKEEKAKKKNGQRELWEKGEQTNETRRGN